MRQSRKQGKNLWKTNQQGMLCAVFDTAPLAKMISSVMFEVQTIGEEFSLEVTDAKIEDKDLERKVKQDFMLIANSVL